MYYNVDYTSVGFNYLDKHISKCNDVIVNILKLTFNLKSHILKTTPSKCRIKRRKRKSRKMKEKGTTVYTVKYTLRSIATTIVLLYAVVIVNLLNVLKEILLPFYRLFFAERHPVFVRTPEDEFKAMPNLGYRFTSKYLELPLGSGANDNLPR